MQSYDCIIYLCLEKPTSTGFQPERKFKMSKFDYYLDRLFTAAAREKNPAPPDHIYAVAEYLAQGRAVDHYGREYTTEDIAESYNYLMAGNFDTDFNRCRENILHAPKVFDSSKTREELFANLCAALNI